MRERSRLVEVLKSVNANVTGPFIWARMNDAADYIERNMTAADHGLVRDLAGKCLEIHEQAASDHIRELAGEAYQYLRWGAPT